MSRATCFRTFRYLFRRNFCSHIFYPRVPLTANHLYSTSVSVSLHTTNTSTVLYTAANHLTILVKCLDSNNLFVLKEYTEETPLRHQSVFQVVVDPTMLGMVSPLIRFRQTKSIDRFMNNDLTPCVLTLSVCPLCCHRFTKVYLRRSLELSKLRNASARTSEYRWCTRCLRWTSSSV